MDIIAFQDLQALSESRSPWCVSLYMPTHRRGRDIEQDPIRFRNMLNEAQERLIANGLRSPDARQLLAPAEALLQDPLFWTYLSDGLALFASPDEFRYFRLALPFEELLVVATRFHLKPLMPFFSSDGHFYILALSQKEVRLLEGTRHTVREVDLKEQLPNLAEALRFDQYERQLQFHTGTATGAGGSGMRPAVFHGHNISDEAKDRILRWFQRIDRDLAVLLSQSQSPVVLAGVDFLFPIFHEANSYPNVLEKGVPGNPEVLKPEDLHEQAWPLVEPIFSEARARDVERYHTLAGTGRTSTDVAESVQAAQNGRVDVLFVAIGARAWGRIDPDTGTVEMRDEAEGGDGDLIDLAAVLTLQNSGTVYALPPGDMPNGDAPDGVPVAAIFRY